MALSSRHFISVGLPMTLLLLSIATRLVNVQHPAEVCWDETHFGKMANWYLNGSFFFDVHPPLGKMLISAVGYLGSYNGSITFENPGDVYPHGLYVIMRSYCSLIGSFLPLLSYLICLKVAKSRRAAILGGCLVLFDTSILTISRFILLDSQLLVAMMVAVYLNCRLVDVVPFTVAWAIQLCLLSLSLFIVVSIKHVGLFVFIWTGLWTASQLWTTLGDVTIPIATVVNQLVVKFLFLAIVPLWLYFAVFFLHFRLLTQTGPGDVFFSSRFQSHLQGNKMHNVSMPMTLAYGSIVSVRHCATGGYLHSHKYDYPDDSGQQVTGYSHTDPNNLWLVKPPNDDPDNQVVAVANRGAVRLEHLPSSRNLHSDSQPGLLSRTHSKVVALVRPPELVTTIYIDYQSKI